LEIFYID
jgi:hypothetical protein